MQVSVETKQNLERRMTVTLPLADVDAQVKDRLNTLRGKVRIDGFRPGKVPFSVIEKRFSEGVRQEVISELIQKNYPLAIEEQKLQPASLPVVDFNENTATGEFVFTADFEVFPTIDLSPLANIEVKRPTVAVTDADVDLVLERMRKQKATWHAVERAAQDGDKVTIDFIGRIDGEAFSGGSSEGHTLVLGDGQMLQEFENGVRGAVVGDTKTFPVTFPQDYFADQVAGKLAEFEVTVKEIQEPALPELNDEFANSAGLTEGGLEGLRSEIRKNLEREAERVVQSRIKRQIFNAIPALAPIEIPNAMIDQELKRLDQQQNSAGQSGRSHLPEDPAEREALARKNVTVALYVQEVIARQEMAPDQNRVNEMLGQIAAGHNNPEQIIDFYLRNPQLKQNFESAVLEDQVVEWLASQAKVTQDALSFEALMTGKE